jgi:hypothetical protein
MANARLNQACWSSLEPVLHFMLLLTFAAETEWTEMTPYQHAKITSGLDSIFFAIPTKFRRDDQLFVWALTVMWSMGVLGNS